MPNITTENTNLVYQSILKLKPGFCLVIQGGIGTGKTFSIKQSLNRISSQHYTYIACSHRSKGIDLYKSIFKSLKPTDQFLFEYDPTTLQEKIVKAADNLHVLTIDFNGKPSDETFEMLFELLDCFRREEKSVSFVVCITSVHFDASTHKRKGLIFDSVEVENISELGPLISFLHGIDPRFSKIFEDYTQKEQSAISVVKEVFNYTKGSPLELSRLSCELQSKFPESTPYSIEQIKHETSCAKPFKLS